MYFKGRIAAVDQISGFEGFSKSLTAGLGFLVSIDATEPIFHLGKDSLTCKFCYISRGIYGNLPSYTGGYEGL